MDIFTGEVRLEYTSPVGLSNGAGVRDYTAEPEHAHLTKAEVPYALAYFAEKPYRSASVRADCEAISVKGLTEADMTFGGLRGYLGAHAKHASDATGNNLVGVVLVPRDGTVLPAIYAHSDTELTVTRLAQNSYGGPWKFVLDGVLPAQVQEEEAPKAWWDLWSKRSGPETAMNRSAVVLPVTGEPGTAKSVLCSAVIAAEGLFVVQHSTLSGVLEYVVGPNADALNGKIPGLPV